MKRASGCLFGMAFGDALGAKTEFMSFDEIRAKYPPYGPETLDGNPALVTDDTQMALAVGEALLAVERPYRVHTLEEALRKSFIAWADSPENDRAPGMTCLTACARLKLDMPWQQATVENSKGCGANMRVQPVGLIKDISQDGRAAIAQFQAAMTHGHPTALAASDLTATTIAMIVRGVAPNDLLDALQDYAISQRQVYHENWLGHLWERWRAASPSGFIVRGWDECLPSLYRVRPALAVGDRQGDPCRFTGGGWIAEEAFATGLLCFLFSPDDPLSVIRRAGASSGDSDSIACLAGAFAGAYCGLDAWPKDWVARIEYRDRLARLGNAWD